MQCLYHFDAVRHKRAMAKYVKERHEWTMAMDGRAPDEQGPPPPEPQKPGRAGSVLNKGTLYGLGCHMMEQGSRALHEGRDTLAELIAGGPGGGLCDLNQIMDNDLYENRPATGTSKFYVRNPHLAGAFLMHHEEVDEQAHVQHKEAATTTKTTANYKILGRKFIVVGNRNQD